MSASGDSDASGTKTQSSRSESVLVDEPTEDRVSGDRVLAVCGPSWSIPPAHRRPRSERLMGARRSCE